MLEGTQNPPQAGIGDASQEYRPKLDRHQSKELFEAVLIRLGVGASHSDVERFFNGRARYTAIVDWRRGRARLPRWAWSYMAAMLRNSSAADARFADQCELADGSTGMGGRPNILKWNARRAKEKPANVAGLSDGDLSGN
jgi:hypothetical protein